MPSPLHLVIGTVVSLAMAFTCGWQVNGWRLERSYEKERADISTIQVKQIQEYMEKIYASEQKLIQANNTIANNRTAITERVRWRVAACPSSSTPSTSGGNATDAGGRIGASGSDFREVKRGVIALGADYDRCVARLTALRSLH